MSQAPAGICKGSRYHIPRYAEVDGHHVHPQYLCDLLGIPREKRKANLCSGCHDLAHHVIRHLVNNGNMGGHRLPAGLRAVVMDFWEWWQANAQRA